MSSPGIYKIEGDVITENFAGPDRLGPPTSPPGRTPGIAARSGSGPVRRPRMLRPATPGRSREPGKLTEVEFNGESTPVHALRTVQGEDATTTFELTAKGRKSWDSSAKPRDRGSRTPNRRPRRVGVDPGRLQARGRRLHRGYRPARQAEADLVHRAALAADGRFWSIIAQSLSSVLEDIPIQVDDADGEATRRAWPPAR